MPRESYPLPSEEALPKVVSNFANERRANHAMGGGACFGVGALTSFAAGDHSSIATLGGVAAAAGVIMLAHSFELATPASYPTAEGPDFRMLWPQKGIISQPSRLEQMLYSQVLPAPCLDDVPKKGLYFVNGIQFVETHIVPGWLGQFQFLGEQGKQCIQAAVEVHEEPRYSREPYFAAVVQYRRGLLLAVQTFPGVARSAVIAPETAILIGK